MKARSIKLTPKAPMKSTIEIDNSLITNALQATGLTAQQKNTFYAASQKNGITECFL
ncbi:hypothetical protein [Microcoleus anatoxicus]|uniref:hypothetical protein n=1 Tax=Microcoleus anatoxicus TaxID=2705319 RepID=UPI0030C9AE7A